MAAFVQLMHPGPEPIISRANPNCCPPNQGPTHRRKFLRTDQGGDYIVSLSGTPQTGNFTFWGEWEPASNVTRFMLPHSLGMPQYLHTPWLSGGSTTSLPSGPCGGASSSRHNTDPFVFCDPMLYFCCQIQPRGRLDRLSKGDIVAFGSHLHGQFVLDTVFVVADKVDAIGSRVCPLFMVVNKSFLSNNPKQQVYLGATYSNPVVDNGINMFSYFPAKLFNGSSPQPFSRPGLSSTGILASLINPALKRGFRCQTISNAGAVWSAIANTVQIPIHGCVFGLVAR